MLCKLWYRVGQSLERFKKAFSLAEASSLLAGGIGFWRASFDELEGLESKYIDKQIEKNMKVHITISPNRSVRIAAI